MEITCGRADRLGTGVRSLVGAGQDETAAGLLLVDEPLPDPPPAVEVVADEPLVFAGLLSPLLVSLDELAPSDDEPAEPDVLLGLAEDPDRESVR